MKIISLHFSTLRECKARLRKYLGKLEETGLVSREDGYQTILSAIAEDISNKGRYRKIQSQVMEVMLFPKTSFLFLKCYCEDSV